ncbi:hypothetical protein AC578_8532 [Pseudocercospora eumusae]|uniref:GATA-type domain-containing protein n=1 Tax=Pseudocercospora eumusae TaxID=321146 RepID=A0A139HW96_9PEZI|nr:hypothetical protein AC578_8532 [Pseudocercospora eumusae]
MLSYALSNPPQSFQRPMFAEPISPSHDIRNSDYDTKGRRPSRPSYSSIGEQDRQASLDSGIGALGALANIAANAPAAITNQGSSGSGENTRSSTPTSSTAMAMSQTAPAATAGYGNQNGSAPPICANCQTSVTPLWRRDESGSVLCNACGLFLKLHGRPRPISLKSDVIKSRNRVKTSQPKKRDSPGGQDGNGLMLTNGYSAAHPDAAHVAAHAPGTINGHQHGFPMGGMTGHMGEPSLASRSNTPGLHQQNSNHSIAPQHIFDTVSLPSDTFASPSLPAFNLRNPSPAPTANGNASHMGVSSNHEDLVNQNNTLRTRVSELEVINDLFRGRVSELEASEQDARQKERSKDAEVQRYLAELATAKSRAAELERRLKEFEEEGPARKKARTDSDSNRDTTSEPGSAVAE